MENPQEKPIESLLYDLRERAKELNCLYEVQELLYSSTHTTDETFMGIVDVLPPGWQYPENCEAQIIINDRTYQTSGYRDTPWIQSADIFIQDQLTGHIKICYTKEFPLADEGPFLKEERKMINTIAEQIGFFMLHEKLSHVFERENWTDEELTSEWRVILDLLKRTDPGLLMRITRKLITFLVWNDVQDAETLISRFFANADKADRDENRPFTGATTDTLLAVCDEVFEVASRNLPYNELLDNIRKWTKEDRAGFLVDKLANPNSSFGDICQAFERYHLLAEQGIELTSPREQWFRAALIRRTLCNQPDYVGVAKKFIEINDFIDFMRCIIFPPDSHGGLGGKSSGAFLANKIIQEAAKDEKLLANVKTPITRYLTSDCLFYFMSYNDLVDIHEQKYKDLNQVRREYPYIVNLFKSSPFPPEIIKSLSLVLDDLGDSPIIVRSSSLLEDRSGAAFAGKYKSLFIANIGSKDERLAELMDAVKEVFASMYGPDPIEYRIKHNLIDHHEEMGIMIQQVVGTRIGDCYLPSFAGVAFSNNEFRWSPRIRREDGLVRLVPGLGTRAVDRVSNDYPILVAPGQPALRVNVTLDEVIHYSPHMIDVINIKSRNFESVPVDRFLKNCGEDYPMLEKLVSVVTSDGIHPPRKLSKDFLSEPFTVTFEGLLTQTSFIDQIRSILQILQKKLGFPVDIEFAHDGTNLYLLQCRSQYYREDSNPATIRYDWPADKVVFSANRYIPNGLIQDISHIVYVDPNQYSELSTREDLISVGQAISALNQALPARHFILIGPGRWGSRGDPRLGVNITYSDIANTAMLIEVSHKQKGYEPEPSFGTHFFQDLVETGIRYLPIYPDDPRIVFNEKFLTETDNSLSDLEPEYSHLDKIIRVIDVPTQTNGLMLQVLMNSDKEEAVAVLTPPGYF